MRCLSNSLAAFLLFAGPALAYGQSPLTKPNIPETCGDYGTSVRFEKSPKDAAKKAAKEEKLVMVLHISGLFEDPDFT
jgi:hypothetical protein